MIGSLPRLHRWIVALVCAVAGAGLGAWIDSMASANADYACGEVLLGVCLGTTLNLLPIAAGTALGLIAALLLVYDPGDPHRSGGVAADPPGPD